MRSMSQSTDPFLQLREHAAKRATMTKAQLLEDAKLGDEAYINASAEAEMQEAYADSLEKHLRAHGCEHDFSTVVDAPEEV